MVKCEVIGYTPKAQEMADKIERRANEMASEGYALVTRNYDNITNRCERKIIWEQT